MIKKRKLANNKYSVTFSMPAMDEVTELYLVGDFNEWSPSTTPLAQAKDGSWSAKLTLEGGKDYQYRYRDDKGNWYNDWDADGYRRNEYGSDNSVVMLINGVKDAPAKKTAARKKKTM